VIIDNAGWFSEVFVSQPTSPFHSCVQIANNDVQLLYSRTLPVTSKLKKISRFLRGHSIAPALVEETD
jgi:hypothetical protein